MDNAEERNDLAEQFLDLARGTPDDILGFLPKFENEVEVDGTKALLRTHFIAHDANETPAVDLLAAAMSRAALDFCIPRDKISAAHRSYAESGATDDLMSLTEQVRRLFVASTKSGEGGELLLFILMERILQHPQILSKMALKTNTQVHVHGSDGVHASLAEDGVLDVYWGESKLYKSSSAAFKDCFESIAPFLRSDGNERRKQDLLLVRDHLNVEEAQLAAHLLEYFDESNPKRLKVRWNGVCLVGFSQASYPDIEDNDNTNKSEIRKAVERWNRTVKDRLVEFEIAEVGIDVFCIPMPDVDDLRSKVMFKLGVPI